MSTTLFQAASKSRARTTCLRTSAASLAVILFSGCQPEPTTAVDRPLAADELARVGPAVISVEAFLAERTRTSSPEPDAVLLERLIQRELLYAEAHRVAFDQSSKLQAAWKNLVIQRFQEELENQAEAQTVVTVAELDGEYVQHPERYSLPAQARVALLQLPAGSARGRAEEVRAEGLRTAKQPQISALWPPIRFILPADASGVTSAGSPERKPVSPCLQTSWRRFSLCVSPGKSAR